MSTVFVCRTLTLDVMAAALEFYFYTNEIGLVEIKLFGYIKTVPLLGMDSADGEGQSRKLTWFI